MRMSRWLYEVRVILKKDDWKSQERMHLDYFRNKKEICVMGMYTIESKYSMVGRVLSRIPPVCIRRIRLDDL